MKDQKGTRFCSAQAPRSVTNPQLENTDYSFKIIKNLSALALVQKSRPAKKEMNWQAGCVSFVREADLGCCRLTTVEPPKLFQNFKFHAGHQSTVTNFASSIVKLRERVGIETTPFAPIVLCSRSGSRAPNATSGFSSTGLCLP